MSGAGFILAINLVVAGLVAASFLMIAAYDRGQIAPRWMAVSYLTGMAYFVCELLIPLVGPSQLSVPIAFSVFLAATIAFNAGLAHHYRVAVPWRLMAALFVVSAVEIYLIQDLPRHSLWRMTFYQAPYALMQLIGLWIVWRSRERNGLDVSLMILLGASAAQFLSKPLLAAASGGWGSSPQAYIDSTYAMISQTLGAVFGFAMALLMLVILTRAILTAATARSETDPLSGLLNRRGFEARAEFALREAARRGMPVSLVIADIDRFKLINDTFGHASGDRVIEAFAGFLSASASDHHAAGRIGGEEFAILLPGANLPTARLFAEGTRSAFAGLAIDGLPDHRRFTASFGVAELLPGESIAQLLARADAALYTAKKEGRNCVRIAVTNVTRFPRQMVG